MRSFTPAPSCVCYQRRPVGRANASLRPVTEWTMRQTCARAVLFLVAVSAFAAAEDARPACFAIRVVDEQTGRGVPLVELRTDPLRAPSGRGLGPDFRGR